jgi:uncharacterized protein (TIGR03437 family)
MWFRMCPTLVLGALMPLAAPGQEPAIVLVRNAVSERAELSPGSRALINTAGLSLDLSARVQVGGRPAPILAWAGTALGVLLPMDLPPGPASVVVTSRGVSTPPYSISLDAHAPLLYSTGTYPGIYCPYLAPRGTTLVALGLGSTSPPIPAGAPVPEGFPASTVAKPTLTVAGRPAQVLSSTLAPGRNEGIYHIDFRVPEGTSEGTHPVVLGIEGYTATAQLRVASAITTSAAHAWEGSAAPESLMTAYACAGPLATGESSADPRNPSEALAGTVVKVRDSAGIERSAALLYAAPGQVNYMIPQGTALGDATITIVSSGGSVSTARAKVEAVAPGLFGYVASHVRYAMAQLVRVRDGVQTVEPLMRLVDGRPEPMPIEIGPLSDELHLILYGTGWRSRSSLANVKVILGSAELPVQYAGPQGVFAGLDQINVRLPGHLAPSLQGTLGVGLWIDGQWTASEEAAVVFRD